MHRPVDDFVGVLAVSARMNVLEGYYAVEATDLPHRSLRGSLLKADGTPLVAEVKFRSPSEGQLRRGGDPLELAKKYQSGGAAAVSVLTEPKHFEGRLEYVTAVKKAVEIPVLMKDIVIDPVQIDAASKVGADAILLMDVIYRARLSNFSLNHMIDHAHSRGLEVVLEAHTEPEYAESLRSRADIVGINNRDLRTLQVSLETSKALLAKYGHPKMVICESGLSTRKELEELRSLGADGFLVGSALMRSGDVESAVRELVGAT